MQERIMPQIIEYTYRQGDIVAYSLTIPEGRLEGTGRIVGVATAHLPIMGSIYMVEDPENFPNNVYHFSTIPMQESALELIGHVPDEYLLISEWPDTGPGAIDIQSFGKDYKAAKKALMAQEVDTSCSHRTVRVLNQK